MLEHPLRTADARRIGVVIALSAEARTFERALGPDVDVSVVGPGLQRAEAGARTLIERGAGALLSWGTSGALVDALPAGRLLLAESLRAPDGVDYPTDPRWLALVARVLAPLDPHRTRCVTVARPVKDLRAKKALARDSGGEAVDMEAAAVAAVAAAAAVPFLAVRSIVDPVDCDLPRCVMAGLDANGEAQPARLLGALARQPWEIVGLLKLALHFGASLRALRAAAALLAAATPAAHASAA